VKHGGLAYNQQVITQNIVSKSNGGEKDGIAQLLEIVGLFE
jgi:hypothetical protein